MLTCVLHYLLGCYILRQTGKTTYEALKGTPKHQNLKPQNPKTPKLQNSKTPKPQRIPGI